MKKVLSIAIIVLIIMACSKSDDDNGNNIGNDNYNRVAMQTNLADNIIIPALQDLNTDIEVLVSAKNTFVTTQNQANLETLRDAWLNAYKTWQSVEMFNIGKAEELLYSFQMNVYPTSVEDIESNILNGDYDLTNVNNNDAVGFPALDYLLYGVADEDAEILNVYSNNNYINYLSDIVDQMKMLTQTVLTDWTSNYRTVFINSTENTVSSSVNKFVNDFIYYYEKGLRANKIGIPAGVFSPSPLPNKIETLYNEEASKELAMIALQSAQDVFNGKAYNSNTTNDSFNDYLIALNRNDLATLINARFDAAKEKMQILNTSLKTQVNMDNSKMTEAYDALQLIVVSLKVDMLQAFNMSVDYVDADGD